MSLAAGLDRRPLVLAIAGPNGAGKTTFFEAFLVDAGLRYVNADDLGRELGLGAYDAAALADRLRRELVARRESFAFETVLSDPQGEKVEWLRQTAASGYAVVVVYVGLASAQACETRVAMRVSQGGHDVPTGKLARRYRRSLANLRRAVAALPVVLVYDNTDLAAPYRLIATFTDGEASRAAPVQPAWLRGALRR